LTSIAENSIVGKIFVVQHPYSKAARMNLNLNDKHVLITGGSKGIGLACAQAFLAEGARVSINSRDAANLNAALEVLKQGGVGADRISTVQGDLCDAAAALKVVEAAEKALGPIDVLVTSAGAAKRTPPDDLTPDAWRAAMDAKYFSYINIIDPVIKRMGARKTGTIVNVIGAGGKVASSIHLPGGAANAALMLATAGLANAYGGKGVRVNAVNPGATLTDRLKEGFKAEKRLSGIEADEAMKRAVSKTALGRLAEPSEIANVVLFLASDQASYVSGVIIGMDGVGTPMVV
jgi:NAD(P)-dependent dehydrogenase (short-subunit alcohol dehydrogenase family)